jgi:hypothetical protein
MRIGGNAHRNGSLDIVTHRLGDAQAKWERLIPSDCSAVRTARDLAAAVRARYGLSHDQARREVEGWLRGDDLWPAG